MKKFESINSSLFKKEVSKKKLQLVSGGLTLTGCKFTATKEASDCNDMDQDSRIEMSIV